MFVFKGISSKDMEVVIEEEKHFLGKASQRYLQTDIDNTIAKIMKVLPEIVYLIVGIALIFVVIVVLVPCIQVYMGGWLFSAAGV